MTPLPAAKSCCEKKPAQPSLIVSSGWPFTVDSKLNLKSHTPLCWKKRSMRMS